jgi:hypothetical protein
LHLVEALACTSAANVQVVKFRSLDSFKAFDGRTVGAFWLERDGGSCIAKVTVVDAFVIHLEDGFFVGKTIG